MYHVGGWHKFNEIIMLMNRHNEELSSLEPSDMLHVYDFKTQYFICNFFFS